MHMFTITFLLVLNTQHAILLHKKCCDAGDYLKKNISIYFCEKDNDKRLQIFTNETNFLKKAVEGTCFDTFPNITEYKIKNHSVVEGKPIPVNFYPKCCPLGHFYHSEARSCVKTDNLDEGFITQNFVKVGLPECKVIVDYQLIPGRYNLELGKLFIGESTQDEFQEGHFCIDRQENGSLIGRGCYEDLSVCYNGIRCLHKCCPDGQSFIEGPYCKNTYVHGMNLSFTERVNNSEAPFAIFHNYNCKLHYLKDTYLYYVDIDGVFYAFYNKTNSYRRFELKEDSYCIENVQKGSKNGFHFLMCNEVVPISAKMWISRWVKLVSCLFIIVTIVVYLFLPEMMNLFGKILLSYCVAVLVLFGSLAIVQFKRDADDTTCAVLSFFFSYMSLVTFSWLNVMCFDIWCTFGSPKSVVTAQRRHDVLVFMLYSLYGWGTPIAITTVTYLAYGVFETPYLVRPILGFYNCAWELRPGNYGKLLFYGVPLIIYEIVNVVFFIKTIVYCLKVKKEINRMNDNRLSTKEKKNYYNVDKEQLLLIFKLSIIMGISFSFEVVSSLFDFRVNPVTEYIEIVWDTINCLQGAFIFLIFICKPKVYRLCLNRIRTAKDRKISTSSSLTTTQLTEMLPSKSRH